MIQHLPESLLEDTRRFQTKHLWEAKKLYESRQENDDVEDARHLATLQVLRERGELLDAICEQCSPTTSLYCPRCVIYTCIHYSLESEPDEHRCNWCEGELEEPHESEAGA